MKKLYAVLLGALLVLGGCGLFTPVEYTKNFKINGVVINGATGELVQGATVIWTSFSEEGGKEFTTSENGVFNIGGGEHGSYTLYVKKDGFTNNAVTVDVNGTSVLIPDMGITSYDSTVNAEIVIYPKNKSVTFNIKLADDNFGNYDIDTSIPVYAKLVEDSGEVDSNNDTIYNSVPYNPVYTGTIAADGLVTFTDLPAAPSVEFGYGSFEVGTHMYDAASLGVLDLTAADETIEDQTLYPVSGFLPEIVSTNLDDNFGVSESITVSFNKAIDDEESSFNVSNFAVEETWAADMKSVTLVVDRTLAIDTAYILNYTLTTIDGYVGAASTVSFSTTEGIDYVSSNIGDYTFNNFAIDGDIVVNFNQNFDRVENVKLKIDGSVNVLISYTATGSTLTVNPVDNLYYNRTYTLSADVYGSGDNATDMYSLSRTFTTVEETTTVAAVTTPIISIDSNYNYDSTLITVTVTNNGTTNLIEGTDDQYTEIPDNYYVYARVVDSAMDWIEVGSATNTRNDYDYGHEYDDIDIFANLAIATYSDHFDVFVDDGALQTPFPNETAVEFMVKGEKDGVYSEASSEISVTDEIRPEVDTTDVNYSLDADWAIDGVTTITAGTQLTFVLPLTEYISGLPSISISAYLDTRTNVNELNSYVTWTTPGSPDSITVVVSFTDDIILENSSLDSGSDFIELVVYDSSNNDETISIEFSDLDTPQVSP